MAMTDDSVHNTHLTGSQMSAEHAALFNLVKHADATHVAVASGSWFDPSTWEGGVVPGDGARVVIADGVQVDYGGVSDARLFTVRVDGSLRFETDVDSKMVVDTLVVDPHGTLTIGTQDDPVLADVKVDIVIANNGAIDVSWDPMLLSRGVISHGSVEIHGQEKLSHLKVLADPMAGDTSIAFAEAPQGWSVGDSIVIAGTHYEGYKWDNDIKAVRHYEPEDEVRTITRIDDGVVFFDEPLVHDHDAPRADLKTSVANYTRNVTIATENSETAAVHERGHVMFMHSDDVDVRYAAFEELGRTDKSTLALKIADVTEMASDTNVQGRYSFHIHKSGVDDAANPAIAVGNAVWGSPGWGYVHHDSNAVLHQNASYNTFGAGFVAESGNETGSWTENIAIYAKGRSWAAPKNEVDLTHFDTARTGDGFWFQGRMVESAGNVAASVNHGFAYFHRGGEDMLRFDASVFDLPEALGLSQAAAPGDAPILGFRDNEAFAAREGLHVVKANLNQGHDVHSVLDGFTAWSVQSGAHFQYTSHYTIKDFDLVAKETERFSASTTGISFGPNTTDMTIVRPVIDGFDGAGIDLQKNLRNVVGLSPEVHEYTVIDADIRNVGTAYLNHDPALDTITTSALLPTDPFRINLSGPLYYKEGSDGRRVAIDGDKTDGLGKTKLPSGTDSYDASRQEVIRILETDGWFSAADGKRYFVLEDYYSDRLTGEIHKIGHLIEIDANVPLGNQYHSYRNAKYNGLIDLDSTAPTAGDDRAETALETDVVIDLLANDTDPDGDAIRVDGIVQPTHGKVFDNGDGTVTYRPDFGFSGVDEFKYWTTDGFGNFTPAVVTVEVDAQEPMEAPQVVAEVGRIDIDHTEAFVAFSHAFLNPIVFAQVVTTNGGHTVEARVDDVTSEGFTLRLQEPTGYDGLHVIETVSYVIVEAGDWRIGETRLKADSLEVDKLVTEGLVDVGFGAGFDGTPVVLSEIQTMNGADFVRTRHAASNEDGFSFGLEKDEAQQTSAAAAEKVGWLAVEPGAGALDAGEDSFLFQAGHSTGVNHKWHRSSFDVDFDPATTPNVIANLASLNDEDSAGVRINQLDADRLFFKVEEDGSRDRETWHGPETIDWLAIGGDGLIYGDVWG